MGSKWIVATLLAGGLVLTGCASSGTSSSPDPEVAISDSDGSLAVGEGSKLPDSWPTDLPAPDGIRLQSVVDSGSRTVALYLGPGDAKKLGQQLKSDLADNGYEQQATTTAGAETVTKYLKDSTEVEVSVGQTGSDVSITMTVDHLS